MRSRPTASDPSCGSPQRWCKVRPRPAPQPILARRAESNNLPSAEAHPRFFFHILRDPPPSRGVIHPTLTLTHPRPPRPLSTHRRARCGARQAPASHARGCARRFSTPSSRADAARRRRRRDRLRRFRMRVVPLRLRAGAIRRAGFGSRDARGARGDASRARLAGVRRVLEGQRAHHLRGVGRGRRGTTSRDARAGAASCGSGMLHPGAANGPARAEQIGAQHVHAAHAR